MTLKEEALKVKEEIMNTKSPYRKRDLTKHLRKLERKIKSENNRNY